MRFFQRTRGTRILLTSIYVALSVLWIAMYPLRPKTTHYGPILWLFFCLLQIAMAWSYWEITADDLVTHSLGFRRRYKLNRIDYVGPNRSGRKILNKSIQVDYRGKQQTLFITVEHPQQFADTLRSAVAAHEHEPPTTGPLGLSI